MVELALWWEREKLYHSFAEIKQADKEDFGKYIRMSLSLYFATIFIHRAVPKEKQQKFLRHEGLKDRHHIRYLVLF